MDTKYGWLPTVAIALLAAGCNSDWSDRVPEVNAQARTDAPSGQSATGSVEPRAAQSAEDTALNAKIESALRSEPDLHGSAIAVRSQEGVVTLSGTTRDPQLRSMAAQVALSIDGVKLVRNEITLAHDA